MSDDELLFDLGPGFRNSIRGRPLSTAQTRGPAQQSARGYQLDQENARPVQPGHMQDAGKNGSKSGSQQQQPQPTTTGPMHSQPARSLAATGRGPGPSQRCPTSPLSPCSNGTVDVSEELRSPPQSLSSPEVGGPSFRQTSAAAPAEGRRQTGAGSKTKAHSRSAASQGWDELEAELAGEAQPQPKKRRTNGSRLTEEEREAKREAAEADKDAKQKARELDREVKRRQKEREKAEKAKQTQENKAMREMMKQAAKVARAQDREEVQRCKGNFALNEIRVLLDNRFAASRSCRPILEALETNKQSNKPAPLQCVIKEALPMRPYKSALWERYRPSVPAGSSQGAGASQGDEEVLLEQIPYVMVFFEAAELVVEVQRDGLQGLMRKAAAAHPGYTLGIMAEGLVHHCDMRERRENGAFDTRPIYRLIDSLGIVYPGVRYRLARDAAEMADHMLRLTRALARLPYNKEASLLDVYGGKQNTEKIGQLNQTHPLGSFERKTWFEAIGVIPHLAPNAAHAIASKYPSLGNLLSIYLDPSRSAAANAKLLDGLPSVAGGNRVGATTSKKVFSILTASDPDQIVDELS